MVQIWQMDRYLYGDPRLPHHLFPPKRVTPDELSRKTGTLYWKLDTNDHLALSKRVIVMKNDRGLNKEDVFTLDAKSTPNFSDKIEELFEESCLSQDQATMIIDGSAYFDVKDKAMNSISDEAIGTRASPLTFERLKSNPREPELHFKSAEFFCKLATYEAKVLLWSGRDAAWIYENTYAAVPSVVVIGKMPSGNSSKIDYYTNDDWFRILCEYGDLIMIPAYTYFRFTTTPESFVKMRRFYKSKKELQPIHRSI